MVLKEKVLETSFTERFTLVVFMKYREEEAVPQKKRVLQSDAFSESGVLSTSGHFCEAETRRRKKRGETSRRRAPEGRGGHVYLPQSSEAHEPSHSYQRAESRTLTRRKRNRKSNTGEDLKLVKKRLRMWVSREFSRLTVYLTEYGGGGGGTWNGGIGRQRGKSTGRRALYFSTLSPYISQRGGGGGGWGGGPGGGGTGGNGGGGGGWCGVCGGGGGGVDAWGGSSLLGSRGTSANRMVQ